MTQNKQSRFHQKAALLFKKLSFELVEGRG